MKKLTCLLLCAVLLTLSLAGCGQSAQPAATAAPEAQQSTEAPAAQPAEEPAAAGREFTDDSGRTVTLPDEVTKVAVSGPLAQVYVFPLCPELLVGFCKSYSGEAARYLPAEYLDLPELGQLYGGKGTMDLEALLAADPDVVIDVGEAKGSIVEDLDALSEQTGIPFVHIDATVATAAQAYTRLGELTGKTEKAAELAAWCAETYEQIEAIMARVDADGARKTITFNLGDKGLNVLAEGSFHAETVNLVGKNAAELAEVVSSGAGNEVDMEQMLLWDPEVIVFDGASVYDTVGEDPTWQQLRAIREGEYFKVPFGPYGWLASPPAVQRYLGMIWLAELLYPDYTDYELQEKVTEYYGLFYGYDLSDEDYRELTDGALRQG